MAKVLYVNHKAQQCGVYEFGNDIGNVLTTSQRHSIHYCECDSYNELKLVYKKIKPDVIIYNSTVTTMGWIYPAGKYDAPVGYKMDAVHIGTIHDVFQQAADEAGNYFFDYHVAPDPTLLLKNSLVYKTGRLLPAQPVAAEKNYEIPIIGSFGFATPGKNFDRIVSLVQKEFDEAIINLNIPFARFGDNDGLHAKAIAEKCRSIITKPGIRLNVDHSYLQKNDLLQFLAANSINVFLYDDQSNRGISSAVDWALASGRPLAISKSKLFRHLFNCRPSIIVENSSLQRIINNGIKPVKHLWTDFNAETLLWQYERIIEDVIRKKEKAGLSKRSLFKYFVKKVLLKAGILKRSLVSQNQWTKKEDQFEYTGSQLISEKYEKVNLPDGRPLNRILDNEARHIYAPTISFFEKHFPELIAKKIPEANVQQAFVLDTAVRLAEKFENARILAVGSFEDTAVESLKGLNYNIEDIDPVINYDLGTFLTKPGVTKNSYDIVISTSVIEHVEDDVQFVKDIAFLLKEGGYAILTCDYNDKYKKGDDIPLVDFRFYTKKDLTQRLMKAIPDCILIDEPEWDCENPDFYLVGRYNYTFASIVFKKK